MTIETPEPIDWPVRSRELVKFVCDSRLWQDFAMRDDDIVISTWAKAGTNWMQQIVAQLIFSGAPGLFTTWDFSPWIDFRLDPGAPYADRQTHRRFLKTHLPIDTLPYSRTAKYIYLGRDGRDVYWSWYNHYQNFKPEVLDGISALYPDEPPLRYHNPDIRLGFLEWLESDAYPNWPFWSHIQGWFDARNLPNMHLVHFADLKADLPGQIRELADFLELEIDLEKWPVILEHCSFEYMKQQAVERGDPALKGGGGTFFKAGTNGRWRDVLTAEDNDRYEAVAAGNLSPDAARWLASGELPGKTVSPATT
jgi:aryl sulfotransferase